MSRYVSLSVDLDNHWSYLKTHGNEAWRGFPSYLDRVIPLVRDFAEEQETVLTLFVVGQDAELPQNAGAMEMIGRSGHEVANHSFHHEPWLHLKTEGEIEEEIGRAHQAISAATGKVPVGFRGPGFSISQSTMRVLSARAYQYDASTLPTWIGPLARAFYMRGSGLDADDMEQRSQLFGKVGEVLRRNKPYRWEFSNNRYGPVEVPVTTMPLLRIPIHATYLLYLARVSPGLSRAYLAAALALCRMTGTMPSILLHSLDFIGADDIDDLGFFPGMDMAGQVKRDLLKGYAAQLARFGEIVTVSEHSSRAEAGGLVGQRVASLA